MLEEMCHLLEINKTWSTAYHPNDNWQIENLHKTLKSILKARVEDDSQSWDEQQDYCMMVFKSSVMFGRKMRISLDVMMGRTEVDEMNYSEFVRAD